MEVYVELTYCMNGILFIMTYEMISLLLNIHWSFMKILFLSFLSNISVILIYIDYLPYISFLYWFVLFLFFFKKQFFLYFPVFLIVYFSILFFINTLIKESFIYNGILITPISYKNLAKHTKNRRFWVRPSTTIAAEDRMWDNPETHNHSIHFHCPLSLLTCRIICKWR